MPQRRIVQFFPAERTPVQFINSISQKMIYQSQRLSCPLGVELARLKFFTRVLSLNINEGRRHKTS
jgi:hypothetical protein